MKGISPLIAAVLLIAFTVAIATLIMGWFSTLARTTTTTVTNQTSTAVACSNAQVSIQDVYISSGNATLGSARVIVKNTGYSTLAITNVTILNTTGQVFSLNVTPLPSSFTSGSINTVQLNNVSIITCPTTFSKAIVTTNCGGITDIFDSAPICSS